MCYYGYGGRCRHAESSIFFVPCYLHFVLWPITVCQGCWNVSLQPLCWAALQELRNLPGDVKWKYTPRIIFTWIISCLLFHYFSQTYLTPSAMKCVLGHTFSVYNHSFSISFTPPKRQRLNLFSFANPLSRSAPSFPTAVCRDLMCAKRKGGFFFFYLLFLSLVFTDWCDCEWTVWCCCSVMSQLVN